MSFFLIVLFFSSSSLQQALRSLEPPTLQLVFDAAAGAEGDDGEGAGGDAADDVVFLVEGSRAQCAPLEISPDGSFHCECSILGRVGHGERAITLKVDGGGLTSATMGSSLSRGLPAKLRLVDAAKLGPGAPHLPILFFLGGAHLNFVAVELLQAGAGVSASRLSTPRITRRWWREGPARPLSYSAYTRQVI